MAIDKQNKKIKESNKYTSKKHNDINKKKKRNMDTDSDDSFSSSSESDETNSRSYDKLLSKMFPSKYINNKNKAKEELKKLKNKINKSKQNIKNTSSSDEETVIQLKSKKNNNSKNKNNKQNKIHHNKKEVNEEDEDIEEDEEDEEDENDEYIEEDEEDEDYVDSDKSDSEDSDEDYEECDESDVDNKKDNNNKKSKKLNIIFTIGREDEDEWETDEYDSDYEDDDYSTENEDESVSSVNDSDDSDEENTDFNEKPKTTKVVKKTVNKTLENKADTKLNKKDIDTDINNKTLNGLKELLNANPQDKTIQKCIVVYEKEIENQKKYQEKKVQKHKAKNVRIFRKIVKDKNTMNDISFYEKLDIEEQKKIIKELREINKITRIEKPYRMTLLESDIPVQFKAAAIKKINSLRYMEPGSGEFYKIKNWVDTFMRIPFSKYENLPISIDDGVDKCHDFMDKALKTLDSAVYGLNDAKMQIMQMLGQLLTNPKAIGTAIAIHGPPGTGKTSLVKEGISKILNRPFAFIALGGATDSSFLEGHSYTYEGSTWGKIVQILINSNCMNPVIYFDELDKISDTPRGEEIVGILTHLTDTSQNSQFHDKYFAEINFDLSKCLFIFSYNDETKVNPILKDRMYRIMTKGYSAKDKIVISNNYLLPKIKEQVKFNDENIIIPDSTISHIIDTYCNKEDGVRNLKRCFEIIYTKLNLYRLMKPGSNLFENEMSLHVEFPYTVTKDIVDKLIKKEKDLLSTALYTMYV